MAIQLPVCPFDLAFALLAHQIATALNTARAMCTYHMRICFGIRCYTYSALRLASSYHDLCFQLEKSLQRVSNTSPLTCQTLLAIIASGTLSSRPTLTDAPHVSAQVRAIPASNAQDSIRQSGDAHFDNAGKRVGKPSILAFIADRAFVWRVALSTHDSDGDCSGRGNLQSKKHNEQLESDYHGGSHIRALVFCPPCGRLSWERRNPRTEIESVFARTQVVQNDQGYDGWTWRDIANTNFEGLGHYVVVVQANN